jgi:hypothetical protein
VLASFHLGVSFFELTMSQNSPVVTTEFLVYLLIHQLLCVSICCIDYSLNCSNCSNLDQWDPFKAPVASFKLFCSSVLFLGQILSGMSSQNIAFKIYQKSFFSWEVPPTT